MSAPRMSEGEFIERYNELGPCEFARREKADLGTLMRRAYRLRKKGYKLEGPRGTAHQGRNALWPTLPGVQASPECTIEHPAGFGIIASDAHYWPGEITLMHRALVWACKEFKPRFFVYNGDVMDLPTISRFQRIGWESLPKVHEEIEWAQDRTHEIASALPRGARKVWTLGNHDKRFETRLANNDPEFAKVQGVHLKDHFPLWEPCWSAVVNPQEGQYSALIKHRFRGGIHAVHNNLLWTGNHIFTGHLHSAQVRALTYYGERTIWGADSGCVAEPSGRQFVDYTEAGPKNWRSAFLVLRWERGKLLMPQLVQKWDATSVQLGLDIITP